MKKMILTLAIAISSLAAFAGTTVSKPVATNDVENVSKNVLDAFKTEFNTAKEVKWATGNNFYRAEFLFNEKYVFAFYNMDGELIGLTRYISSVDLPLNLQVSLKKNSNGFWISDLFEVSKNETTSYYITLENADTKTTLKSTGGSDWETFKTVKKS